MASVHNKIIMIMKNLTFLHLIIHAALNSLSNTEYRFSVSGKVLPPKLTEVHHCYFDLKNIQ